MNSLLIIEENITVSENTKPDLSGSGFVCSGKNGCVILPNLPESEDLTQEDSVVSNENTKTPAHIRIPYSLLEHPAIQGLTDKQYRIFIHFLQKILYAPYEQNDHGVIIKLEPGQYMFTLRKMASEMGVSKSVVERLMTRLTSVQISRHEVRHQKTIITFIHPDLCVVLKKQSETTIETRSRQDRDKIETQNKKDNKDKKEEEYPIPKSASRFPKDALIFSFDEKKFLGISEQDLSSWSIAYPGINLMQEIVQCEQWILANESKTKNRKLWRKTLTHWFKTSSGKAVLADISRHQNQAVNDEKAWMNQNRANFFKWQKDNPESLKHMEYNNNYIVNKKNGKEMSVKMKPDAFNSLFKEIAGVRHG